MDLTEMLMINLILVILIRNGGGAAIGETDSRRIQWNTMFLRERKEIAKDSEIVARRRRFLDADNMADMREKSYIHKPQEFLWHFAPDDATDAYEIFRKLYLEAFQFEKQPNYTVTVNELTAMGHEFELSKCRKPRMKMIDLYEELGIAPDIAISPPAANVLRCGSNSGCCPKGKTCYHTGDNFKNKTITVLYIEGDEISVKRFNVSEHEACECLALTPSSSSAIPTVGNQHTFNTSPFTCQKQCTSYFKQDPYCQCNVCDPSKHKQCLRVQKGMRTISDVEAQCVESGKCEEPLCNPELYYSYSEKRCMERKFNS